MFRAFCETWGFCSCCERRRVAQNQVRRGFRVVGAPRVGLTRGVFDLRAGAF